MRLATVDLLVGAAKRAKPLEGLDYQECEAGLLLPGAPAHDAIDAPFSQRPGSFGYVFVAHAAGSPMLLGDRIIKLVLQIVPPTPRPSNPFSRRQPATKGLHRHPRRFS